MKTGTSSKRLPLAFFSLNAERQHKLSCFWAGSLFLLTESLA
jgi:hypothetical protein